MVIEKTSTEEMLEWRRQHACLSYMADQIRENWDNQRRWIWIRSYYKTVLPIIEAEGVFNPYLSGLAEKFTPIERLVWFDLRRYGMRFYPQYPVGRRFVDFGDPLRNVAIEVDGAAYHTPEKDAKKDAELAHAGWRVFRISGRDAMSPEEVLEPLLSLYGIARHAE